MFDLLHLIAHKFISFTLGTGKITHNLTLMFIVHGKSKNANPYPFTLNFSLVIVD